MVEMVTAAILNFLIKFVNFKNVSSLLLFNQILSYLLRLTLFANIGI